LRRRTTAARTTTATIATVVVEAATATSIATATASTTTIAATSAATIAVNATLAKGFNVALLLLTAPFTAANAVGVLLAVTSLTGDVVEERGRAIVKVVGSCGCRIIDLSLGLMGNIVGLGVSGRGPGGNSLLDQILLVELGIGSRKVIVGLGNFDLLGWSANAATTATRVLLMLMLGVVRVMRVLLVLLVTTARSTRTTVGLHIVHLARKSVNRGILAGLLLSTGLRQLGHRCRNGLRGCSGGIDWSNTVGRSDRSWRSHWDSWHNAAALLSCGSRSGSVHGLRYSRLRLNGWSGRILSGGGRIAAGGLMVSTGQLGGSLRSGHTGRTWALLRWLSRCAMRHLGRELARSSGREAMARRREPAWRRSAIRHVAGKAARTTRARRERRWGPIEALSIGWVESLLRERLLWGVSGRRLLSSLRGL
jgi:hypothetical protein